MTKISIYALAPPSNLFLVQKAPRISLLESFIMYLIVSVRQDNSATLCVHDMNLVL